MCYRVSDLTSVQCQDGHEEEVECDRLHLDELRVANLTLPRKAIITLIAVVSVGIVWELTIGTMLILSVIR